MKQATLLIWWVVDLCEDFLSLWILKRIPGATYSEFQMQKAAVQKISAPLTA